MTPDWRTESRGLSTEGQCTNKKCVAFTKNVIMSHGYGEFDLVMQSHECVCPMCKEHVVPITCAFKNCSFTWAGIKVATKRGDPPSKIEMGETKTVGDNYFLYEFKNTTNDTNNTCNPQQNTSSNLNTLTKWHSLKITTKQ